MTKQRDGASTRMMSSCKKHWYKRTQWTEHVRGEANIIFSSEEPSWAEAGGNGDLPQADMSLMSKNLGDTHLRIKL